MLSSSWCRELIVIWFLCGLPLSFAETGKEGGGGVQHRAFVSAHDERQEQYPGWWISTGNYNSFFAVCLH